MKSQFGGSVCVAKTKVFYTKMTVPFFPVEAP